MLIMQIVQNQLCIVHTKVPAHGKMDVLLQFMSYYIKILEAVISVYQAAWFYIKYYCKKLYIKLDENVKTGKEDRHSHA